MYSPRLLSPESATDVNAAQPVTCPLLGSAVRRDIHRSGGNSRIRAPQSGTFLSFLVLCTLVRGRSTRGTLSPLGVRERSGQDNVADGVRGGESARCRSGVWRQRAAAVAVAGQGGARSAQADL